MKTIHGYHFTAEKLRNGDPIPPIGEWLKHGGPVVPCQSGLHASEHPLDALTYAPGSLLHKVELRGDLVSHGDPIDKWVGRERKIIASIDATDLLRPFARWCALEVIDLWDAPDVVRKFLTTGDESLRAAAWDAAWVAAGAARAAGAAAWDAARAAARAAGAAGAAAGDAAWAAAGAAWDAARAAWAAAGDAAWAAAGAAGAAGAARAAGAAAGDAAWAAAGAAGAAGAARAAWVAAGAAGAARAAAWGKQRIQFLDLVVSAFNGELNK